MRIYLNISAAHGALPMHIARRYMHKFAVLSFTQRISNRNCCESRKSFRLLRYWSNISYKQVTIIACVIARECVETISVYRDKIFHAIYLFKIRTTG